MLNTVNSSSAWSSGGSYVCPVIDRLLDLYICLMFELFYNYIYICLYILHFKGKQSHGFRLKHNHVQLQ